MMIKNRSHGWFRTPVAKPGAAVKLLCFPYSGAGASALQSWASHFSPEVEAVIVQLPGREDRLAEPCYRSVRPLVEHVASQLPPLLVKPLAIFGHSLGALIGFELARQLARAQMGAPLHLFVSARGAPQLPPLYAKRPNMTDAEFMQELRRLGGTSPEVLQDQDLMELLLPTIRADFGLDDAYVYQPDNPLACPITAFAGEFDPEALPAQMQGWRDQTRCPFILESIAGDHFFLRSHPGQVTAVIERELRKQIRDIRPSPALETKS